MPENQVEEVKQKTDIVSLIGEYLPLKKAGRNYKALCPFHGEKTPSFMVSPELQIYKCFGCNSGGDAIKFLQLYEGMEFREALEFLANRAGVKLASFRGEDRSDKEKLIEINSQALKFYNWLLLNHNIGKRALDYLQKDRGLKPDTIKQFQLGYSPEDIGALGKFLLDKKKFHPKDLERAGIAVLKGQSLIDRFRGRVIFPLFDHRGNPVGFAGRILPWDRRDLAKYINTPETDVYHKSKLLYGLNITKERIKEKKTAIVVEGELDAISSWQAGVGNVVAIKGTALTEDQIRLISRFCPRVILALDSDFAGDEAAKRGISLAANQGLEIKIAQLEGYKDPDEVARGNPALYKKSLISASGAWDFLVNGVLAKYDASSGEGTAKISKEIIPVLALIEDKIVQSHYISYVAQKLSVTSEIILEMLDKIKGKQGPETKEEDLSIASAKKSRRQLLEERFLSLIFSLDPQPLKDPKISSLFKIPLCVRIIEEYLSYPKKSKDFNLSEFVAQMPAELFSGFAGMVLTESGFAPDNENGIKKEINLITQKLEILSLKEGLASLTLTIKLLEEKDDKLGLVKAQEKFKALTQKIAAFEEEAV